MRLVKGVKEVSIPDKYNNLKTSIQFANKVSVAMDDLQSSHVWFIMQMAYGELLEYSEAEEIWKNIQKEMKQLKQENPK